MAAFLLVPIGEAHARPLAHFHDHAEDAPAELWSNITLLLGLLLTCTLVCIVNDFFEAWAQTTNPHWWWAYFGRDTAEVTFARRSPYVAARWD